MPATRKQYQYMVQATNEDVIYVRHEDGGTVTKNRFNSISEAVQDIIYRADELAQDDYRITVRDRRS